MKIVQSVDFPQLWKINTLSVFQCFILKRTTLQWFCAHHFHEKSTLWAFSSVIFIKRTTLQWFWALAFHGIAKTIVVLLFLKKNIEKRLECWFSRNMENQHYQLFLDFFSWKFNTTSFLTSFSGHQKTLKKACSVEFSQEKVKEKLVVLILLNYGKSTLPGFLCLFMLKNQHYKRFSMFLGDR